jgi:hypothetical protein
MTDYSVTAHNQVKDDENIYSVVYTKYKETLLRNYRIIPIPINPLLPPEFRMQSITGLSTMSILFTAFPNRSRVCRLSMLKLNSYAQNITELLERGVKASLCLYLIMRVSFHPWFNHQYYFSAFESDEPLKGHLKEKRGFPSRRKCSFNVLIINIFS